MGKLLPVEYVGDIKRLLAAGNSIKWIARHLGVSLNTVRKYCPEGPRNCGCGRPASHRGQCTFRTDQSPAFQARFAQLKGESVCAPPTAVKRSRIKEQVANKEFMLGMSDDWMETAEPLPREQMPEIIEQVERAVNRKVPLEIRDEIKQDIVLAVFEGRVKREQIGSVVETFFRVYLRNTIGHVYSPHISIDAPYAGTDFTLGTILAEAEELGEDGVWHPSEVVK